MRRLWRRFRRFIAGSVIEYYERDGSVIIVRNSRRTFRGESYEEWLVRLKLDPRHPGQGRYYRSLYLQDYYGRGFMTREEEEEYLSGR